MTDITLEQRARELHIVALMAEGASRRDAEIEASVDCPSNRATERAIEAAMRLSAGEDWVLVPREPTPEMLGALYRMATGADWCPSACNLTKRQLARARKAYAAMLAITPRHETGEG